MSKLSDELGQQIEAFEESDRKIREKLAWLKDARENPLRYYDAVNEEFERMTSLQREDYVYVFLCAGLQCLRQYLLTDFKPRLNDQDAAAAVKGDDDYETSYRWANDEDYRMTVDQIWLNPVPFDAIKGGKALNAGVSGKTHRFNVPGHDPWLGYFFGTVNIMTGTITVIDGGLMKNFDSIAGGLESAVGLKSYLVKSLPERIRYKSGAVSVRTVDKIAEPAPPFSVLVDACIDRIQDDKKEGLEALASAVVKEYIHLKSDRRSLQSLPVPGLSLVSPDLAKKTAEFGFDSLNIRTVGKQLAGSVLINCIVRAFYFVHHYLAGGYTDMHKVRISRILNVANVLATVSNLAFTIAASFWAPDLTRKADIGGTVASFAEICKNNDFIYKMQIEYIENRLVEMINS